MVKRKKKGFFIWKNESDTFMEELNWLLQKMQLWITLTRDWLNTNSKTGFARDYYFCRKKSICCWWSKNSSECRNAGFPLLLNLTLEIGLIDLFIISACVCWVLCNRPFHCFNHWITKYWNCSPILNLHRFRRKINSNFIWRIVQRMHFQRK